MLNRKTMLGLFLLSWPALCIFLYGVHVLWTGVYWGYWPGHGSTTLSGPLAYVCGGIIAYIGFLLMAIPCYFAIRPTTSSTNNAVKGHREHLRAAGTMEKRATLFWHLTGLWLGSFISLVGVYYGVRWVFDLKFPETTWGIISQPIFAVCFFVPSILLMWMINSYKKAHLICPACRQRITILAQFCKSCGSPLWNLPAKDMVGSFSSESENEILANSRHFRALSLIGVWGLCGWTAYYLDRFRWWAVLFAVLFFLLWVYRYWLRCPLCHHYAGVRNNLTGKTDVYAIRSFLPFILMGALLKIVTRDQVDYCQSCGAHLKARKSIAALP